MAWYHPTVSRPLAVAGLLGCLALGWAGRARAQDHTADPYKPYNSMYDSFTYPTYPNGTGYVPNQDVLQGRGGVSGANRFQDFLGGLEGNLPADGSSLGRRRSGAGVPYYSAYRALDRDLDRVYQPNAASDRGFYEDQQARNAKYLEYLRERDPKKRAQLYREYMQDTNRATRALGAPRSAAGRAPAAGDESSGGLTAPGLARDRSAPSGRPEAGAATSAATPDRNARGLFSNPSPSAPGLFSGPTTRGESPSRVLQRSESMGPGRRPGTTAPGLSAPTRPRGTTGAAPRTRRRSAPGLE